MLGVAMFYGALVLWVALLVWCVRNKKWLPFFIYGLAFTVILNGRYLFEGVETGIMFFTGIFDIVAHIGVSAENPGGAFTTCAGNACTVLPGYETHPSWAVAFYDRFVGDSGRTLLLFGHLGFNTIALIILTVQIFRPGKAYSGHKALGRIGVTAFVLSMICAGVLNSELYAVQSYGHWWTMMGLYFLMLTAAVPAFIGIRAIMRGQVEQHRIWMWRFAGALWGSYWIFRAQMMLVDLLVKDAEGWTLALPAWTAGLIGIALADLIRRRLDAKAGSTDTIQAGAALAK